MTLVIVFVAIVYLFVAFGLIRRNCEGVIPYFSENTFEKLLGVPNPVLKAASLTEKSVVFNNSFAFPIS